MSVIDVQPLLQPVSADDPCGENLEYDPLFGEMQRASEGRPGDEFGGDAEEPDWRAVKQKALELLGRTRDLRVAVHLVGALVNTDGMVGISDGLSVVRGYLEQYWDGVHPQLDPDDDNDPTMRINTIIGLCDAGTTVRCVREASLVDSRMLGRFSLRDIESANGRDEVTEDRGDDESGAPQLATIEAAFMDCDVDALQTTAAAVGRSIAHVEAIEAVLTQHVGSGQAPSLRPLVDVLRGVDTVLAERLARRGVGDAGSARPEAVGAAPVPGATSSEINSREDVARMLDKACAFFRKHEPSSPVPLLLERAKRLISKDFLAILRDMTPEGVSQAETIGGVESEE